MENYYWITYKEGKFDIFHERVTYGDFYGRKSNLHSKMYGEREGDETNILQPRFHKKEDAQKVLNIINDIGHKNNAFKWLGERVSTVLSNLSNNLYKSNYQTERYIASKAPKFWLKTYWGL
jgi:hypothetical protein